MKTQRELLELAAKAAGYQIDQRASFYTWKEHRRLALLNPSGGHTLWNSEEDDGDALRLAVKLDLLQSPRVAHEIAVERFTKNADKLTATRLAIIRAAAAIGEQLDK